LNIHDFLEENRDKILEFWLNRFWDDFGESAYYLKKEVDQFTNPFGYQIRECFEKIVESLYQELNWKEIEPVLDKLAQIRAIQENLPSKAGKVFLILKEIIRDNFGDDILNKLGISALLEIEDKISAYMLRYFDFYQNYRERLYQLKVDEFKRNNYLLLKRAGLILEDEVSVAEEQLSSYKNH